MRKIVPYLKWSFILLFIAAAAAVFSLFISYTRTDSEKLYLTPGMDDSMGWDIYVIDNGQRVYLTPRELIDIDLGRTFYLSRILTQEMRDDNYTLINMSNARPSAVFLDEELIYSNCCGISPKLDETVFPEEFSSYDMRGENTYCTLPENYAGKLITIATAHVDYQGMPIIVLSSMTIGWEVHASGTNSIIIPAAGFAVTALILFGIWLYGVFCGIRNPATLFVIAAAMIQSFSYLRQYEYYSPASTAMDTPLTAFIPVIAVLLPQVYFLFKSEKRRNKVIYSIIIGTAGAAAIIFQTVELSNGSVLCGHIRNILMYFSSAVLIALAVSEAKIGNKVFRLFLGGIAAVLFSIAVLYVGSLAGNGYYSSNIKTVLIVSLLYSNCDLISFFGMVLFMLSAFISFYSIISHTVRIQTELAVQEERLEQLDCDLAVQKQFYESKLSKEEEIRSLRHDMNGHLSTLLALLDENKSDEAASYLSGIIKLHSEHKSDTMCENPYMNAVLTEYSARCHDNHISFTCHIGVGDHTLPSTELCLILNNALENAVEACMKLPEKERRIKVQAAVKQNRFLLRISNRFDGSLSETEVLPVTKKVGKEHGYGLPNIQRAAQRKGGSIKCRTENEYFVLDVQFPLE